MVTDGCFLGDGSFIGAPGFHREDLEEAFQYEVLKMLTKEGKINDAIIENMLSWRHTGFHVHIGARIWPEDETALGNLAKYIIRASFSKERMVYISAEKSADGIAGVVYSSKDGRTKKTFVALDRLACLVVHVPNKYEQLVGYVGYEKNVAEQVYDGSQSQIPPYELLPPGPSQPQHVVAERDRAPIGALKFVLNIFVDKKQVPILKFSSYAGGRDGAFGNPHAPGRSAAQSSRNAAHE